MKLSTKIRYGARLMLDLALNSSEGPVFLKDIAARQEISEKYLWQLASSLKHAGLVSAERGANGGFRLTKAPWKITLKEIFVALEGEIHFGAASTEAHSPENLEPLLTGLWERLSNSFQETLSSVSLEDLVEKYRYGKRTPNYTI